jgi:hypothetical protein
MENFRIRKAEFLNQNSLWELDLTKIFFAPAVKIVFQQYRPKADITTVKPTAESREQRALGVLRGSLTCEQAFFRAGLYALWRARTREGVAPHSRRTRHFCRTAGAIRFALLIGLTVVQRGCRRDFCRHVHFSLVPSRHTGSWRGAGRSSRRLLIFGRWIYARSGRSRCGRCCGRAAGYGWLSAGRRTALR